MASLLPLLGAGGAGAGASFGSPYSGTLLAWYDCYQEAYANNDPVARWTDQYFLTGDVTAAGTARPTFKTNQVNGRPALLFDGVNNLLDNTSWTPASLNGMTVIAVVNITTGGTYGAMVATKAAAGAIVGELRMTSSTFFAEFAAMAGVSPAQDGTHALKGAGWSIVVGRRDDSGGGTNGFKLVPNAEVTSAEAGTLIVTTLGIGGRSGGGGSLWLGGYIAEVLIYGSSLSAGNQTTTINYLKAKYAL